MESRTPPLPPAPSHEGEGEHADPPDSLVPPNPPAKSSLRGAERRGNLIANPQEDCHVGLWPPRNDDFVAILWDRKGVGHKQSVTLKGRTLTWRDQDIQIESREQLFDTLRKIQPTATNDWVTYLGYEFYRWCDDAFELPEESDRIDLYLLECEHWEPRVQSLPQAAPVTAPTEFIEQFEASFTPEGFEQAVQAIQQDIEQGDIYQANLSLALTNSTITTAEAEAIFETLRTQNPSPYAGFLKTEHGVLISNSPERLLKRDGDHIETRPIAGTRGRSEKDEVELLENPKERAEHLMLVDLLRNDLGRVCEAGSVAVDELLVLERYSHVTHLVSNVIGKALPTVDAWEMIRAVFPGGTITGCPKIRCIEILNEIEPVDRGFYTGSLGYLSPDGQQLDLNILIRSLFLGYNGCRLHVGAGIVADSTGAHEYRECLRKAQALLGALFDVTQHPDRS